MKEEINLGFSKQADEYDRLDKESGVMKWYRNRIRNFIIEKYPSDTKILEINCGSGLDAVYFAQKGFEIVASDISTGMIASLNLKINNLGLQNKIKTLESDFNALPTLLQNQKFDIIFSNFGGLNCIENPENLLNQFQNLLNENGKMIFVIMPPVCPWEILYLLKLKFRFATRRWSKKGTLAHLNGHYFKVYYPNICKLVNNLKTYFSIETIFSLGYFVPPPTKENFDISKPLVFKFLVWLEKKLSSHPPFKYWGDYVLIEIKKATLKE